MSRKFRPRLSAWSFLMDKDNIQQRERLLGRSGPKIDSHVENSRLKMFDTAEILTKISRESILD